MHVLHGHRLVLSNAGAKYLGDGWDEMLEPDPRLRGRMIPLGFINAVCSGLTYSEALVYLDLVSEGYEVLRGGWPDLLALREDAHMGVEVKHGGDKLNDKQVAMHGALQRIGFPVEVRHYK